jgi:hypothetical protein
MISKQRLFCMKGKVFNIVIIAEPPPEKVGATNLEVMMKVEMMMMTKKRILMKIRMILVVTILNLKMEGALVKK